MKKMMVIAAVGLMAAMTFTAQCSEKAQDGVQGKRQDDVVVKMPGIQKIDMENLLDVPVGSTLLDTGIKRVTQEEDVLQIEVPLEWSEKAKCRALRVSHVLVDNRRLIRSCRVTGRSTCRATMSSP